MSIRTLLVGALLFAMPSVSRSEGLARQVLGAKSEHQKGQAAVKGRKGGLDAADVLTVIRKERYDSVVSLVAGMYLEKGKLSEGTVVVVRALAGRQGMFGRAAVMAAWSPHAESIVKGLIGSNSESSRRLAATIVATYAHADSLGNLKGGGKGNRKGGGGNAGVPRMDIEPFVTKLLGDRDAAMRELALLAAAYGVLDGLADRIRELKPTSSGLAGARLLYLAAIDDELPEDQVRKVLGARVSASKRYARLTPLLHSYDIRGNGLLYACQAVAWAEDKRFLKTMHRLLAHPDLRVQIEAAYAVEAIGSQESVPVLLEKTSLRTPWPVKVALLSAIGAIPSKKSVGLLFGLRKDEKGRFRQDATYALLSIVPALEKEPPWKWEEWWAEKADGFTVDADATKAFRESHRVQDIEVEALVEFYGCKVISNRAVFVLDTSMSMKGEKIKMLKHNTSGTLGMMPDHMEFNVVDFGGIVRVMRPGSLIDARHRESAKQAVDYMDLTLGTRTFDAMEAAIRLPGMDTIIYLSDGMPIAGAFESWSRIAGAFDMLNRHRPVAVYCIIYGGKAPQAGKAGAGKGKGKGGAMESLCDHNAGTVTHAH